MALRHLSRGGGITRDQALFEEMPLHRITCEGEGGQEMFACVLVPSSLKLKFAKRSEVEGIFWRGALDSRSHESLPVRAERLRTRQ